MKSQYRLAAVLFAATSPYSVLGQRGNWNGQNGQPNQPANSPASAVIVTTHVAASPAAVSPVVASPVVASSVIASPVNSVPASTNTATSSSGDNDLTSDSKSVDTSTDTSSSSSGSADCIDITFTFDATYQYYFNGGWGSTSGTTDALGSGPHSLCNSGALFIGTQTKTQGLGAATGGNTKLECTVNGGSNNVCDVSVCDGFSVAMSCTGFSGGAIGGGNLFTENSAQCPDKNTAGPTTTCVNTGSHTSTAPAWFVKDKYWANDNAFVGASWATSNGNPKVTCAISHGGPATKKLRREAEPEPEPEAEAEADAWAEPRSQSEPVTLALGSAQKVSTRHVNHKGRAHARGLRMLLEDTKL